MKRSRAKTFTVGVDLGGTKILAAVFDERHRVVVREKKSTKPELGAEAVMHRVAECVNEALAVSAVSHASVLG
ncbi:MAG: ROK family protein, partial [Verrucomicrobiae bacterium]|nr:ROK family protein [Verrucomicrobiae bacterium]